jgi:dehydrogenase/reductase SDR family member 12
VIASVIDTVLDRSIALGYGRPGLLVRERMPGWAADPPRIDGRTVLITGAASGLGLAAAVGFAGLGARVHALARDEARAADAVARIIAAVPSADVTAESCDVSDLEAVRSFGERFTAAAAETRLDVLVNNAGTMPAERTRSPGPSAKRSRSPA